MKLVPRITKIILSFLSRFEKGNSTGLNVFPEKELQRELSIQLSVREEGRVEEIRTIIFDRVSDLGEI